MSWFDRSIANSLKPKNDEQHIVKKNTHVSTNQNDQHQHNSHQSPERGVKQDLSEISKTLTRQFSYVVSILGQSNERSEPYDREAIAGIRRDFAEIGGRFRSGISKLASDFLQFESDDDDDDSIDGDGVGVTDDVVAFAGDIAMHPETWLDFPLPEDEDDGGDFHLSYAQQEHAFAVERLAPRLSALKIDLCPNYMSESSFWKIYFVLLHPRLERDAAELLSTPNILKARALLTHEFKNRSYSKNTSDSKPTPLPLEVSAIETVKHPIKNADVQIVDKSVIQEDSHEGKTKDEDDWLKEESLEIVTNRVAIPIESNEDVSFSDLEDDDDDDDDGGNIPIHYKKATYSSDSSTKSSRNRVQLNQSSTDSGKDNDSSKQVTVHNSVTKESRDWLDVVDIDVA